MLDVKNATRFGSSYCSGVAQNLTLVEDYENTGGVLITGGQMSGNGPNQTAALVIDGVRTYWTKGEATVPHILVDPGKSVAVESIGSDILISLFFEVL